jgi:broad specificity phosphatase PhoE
MGKLIKDRDKIPSLIISSTALRAKTTAEIVAKGFGYQGDIVLDHSLYEAKPKDYLTLSETLPDSRTQSNSRRYNSNAYRFIRCISNTIMCTSASQSTNR